MYPSQRRRCTRVIYETRDSVHMATDCNLLLLIVLGCAPGPTWPRYLNSFLTTWSFDTVVDDSTREFLLIHVECSRSRLYFTLGRSVGALKVYSEGDDVAEGGGQVLIEGGSFINNEALELGGAIVAWGADSVVTITGGVFENNTAR